MKARPALLLFLAVTMLGLGTGLLPWKARSKPRLITPQPVPTEVEAAIRTSWESFLDAFPAQRSCIGSVGLVLVERVEGGDAAYQPDSHIIRVEIPTTADRFPQLFVHELGHHLESVCDTTHELRMGVAAAQDLIVQTNRDVAWFEDPSEHLADAVVEVVLGARTIHVPEITLSHRTGDLVASWGASASSEILR